MIEHLRQRVIEILSAAHTVTLSTYGEAGLQSTHLPCEALGIALYVLVPRTSDHLFNLETRKDVAVVDSTWNLKGSAQVVSSHDYPSDFSLLRLPEAAWSTVIRICPSRLTIMRSDSGSPVETIDVD